MENSFRRSQKQGVTISPNLYNLHNTCNISYYLSHFKKDTFLILEIWGALQTFVWFPQSCSWALSSKGSNKRTWYKRLEFVYLLICQSHSSNRSMFTLQRRLLCVLRLYKFELARISLKQGCSNGRS